jgi:hypothetical protein
MKSLVLVMVVSLGACSRDAARPRPSPAEHAQTHAHDPVLVPSPTAKAPPKPAQLTHVTIKALGMYCEESCPMRVRYAVAAIPSIYELGFDTSTESIFVSYDTALGDPKTVTTPIIAAIKNAGFDPWLGKEIWPADAQAIAEVVKR